MSEALWMGENKRWMVEVACIGIDIFQPTFEFLFYDINICS